MMKLETISSKQLNEMERLSRELVTLMRKTKLQDEPLAAALHQLEVEIGKIRRIRFDEANPEYHAY
jgi:hypothetical protein